MDSYNTAKVQNLKFCVHGLCYIWYDFSKLLLNLSISFYCIETIATNCLFVLHCMDISEVFNGCR